jgi:hypothetical protein
LPISGRAAEGTTAAAHNANAAVNQVLTAGVVKKFDRFLLPDIVVVKDLDGWHAIRRDGVIIKEEGSTAANGGTVLLAALQNANTWLLDTMTVLIVDSTTESSNAANIDIGSTFLDIRKKQVKIIAPGWGNAEPGDGGTANVWITGSDASTLQLSQGVTGFYLEGLRLQNTFGSTGVALDVSANYTQGELYRVMVADCDGIGARFRGDSGDNLVLRKFFAARCDVGALFTGFYDSSDQQYKSPNNVLFLGGWFDDCVQAQLIIERVRNTTDAKAGQGCTGYALIGTKFQGAAQHQVILRAVRNVAFKGAGYWEPGTYPVDGTLLQVTKAKGKTSAGADDDGNVSATDVSNWSRGSPWTASARSASPTGAAGPSTWPSCSTWTAATASPPSTTPSSAPFRT